MATSNDQSQEHCPKREVMSLCPVCLERISGHYIYDAEQSSVRLEKTCPKHGIFSTPVWRGAPFMDTWRKGKIPTPPMPWNAVDKGCPFDCGLCARHAQHTCTAVLDITSRCNLRCRFCFADSGSGALAPALAHYDEPVSTSPLDLDTSHVMDLLNKVHAQSGQCNLQLSGGEPTLHPDLCAIIAHAKTLFPFVQLNTNGIIIGRRQGFAKALADAGLDSVFLQFDGTENEIYGQLRGAPWLETKLRAIDALGEAGIGVVLVPTVVPSVNTHNIGEIVQFAVGKAPIVRGVHFQPVSHFGRHPSCKHLNSQNKIVDASNVLNNIGPTDAERVSLPEVMQALESQTNGMVAVEDFLPPSCEHELCSFHANYLVSEDGLLQRVSAPHRPLDIDEAKAIPACDGAMASRAFVRRQWKAPEVIKENATPSHSCCSPNAWQKMPIVTAPQTTEIANNKNNTQAKIDDLDRFLARAKTHMFAVSGMAFQDVWTLDLERLRGCCIHAVAPDGRLVPFCSWNCTAADGTPLHRNKV
ncbi:MAG: radical SAM protein [Pseudomonadota bacterium]